MYKHLVKTDASAMIPVDAINNLSKLSQLSQTYLAKDI